jgi:hypothetical protein
MHFLVRVIRVLLVYANFQEYCFQLCLKGKIVPVAIKKNDSSERQLEKPSLSDLFARDSELQFSPPHFSYAEPPIEESLSEAPCSDHDDPIQQEAVVAVMGAVCLLPPSALSVVMRDRLCALVAATRNKYAIVLVFNFC